MTDPSKRVIILSTGRTGTMTIARYFGSCQGNIVSVHEPWPSRILRLASGAHMTNHMATGFARALLSACRYISLRRIGDSMHYVESNNFLFGLQDVLEDVFGKVDVIHVVRDPKAYIRSHLNFGGLRGRKRLASDYLPFWMIKPEHFRKNPKLRWSQMSDAEKLAFRWAKVNGELNRGSILFGDRYHRVRFEDIFDPNSNDIQDLAESLGFDTSTANSIRKKFNTSSPSILKDDEFSESDICAIRYWCHDLSQLYGYDEKKVADQKLPVNENIS